MTGSPAQGEGDGGPARPRGHGPGGSAPSPVRATFLFCGRSSRVAKPLGSFEDSELLFHALNPNRPGASFSLQVSSAFRFRCDAPRPLLRSAPRGRVAPPAVRPSLQSPQRAAQLTLRSRSLSAWTEAPGSATPAPHSLDGEKPGPGRPSLLRWGPGRCGRKGRGAPPPSSLPRSVLAVAPRGSSAPGRPLPRIPGSSSRCAPLVFIQKKNVISVFQSCFA